VDITRVSPPNAGVGGRVAHVLLPIALHTREYDCIERVLLLPIAHVGFLGVGRDVHDAHGVGLVPEGQVDLSGSPVGRKGDLAGERQEAARGGKGVVVVVFALGVDFRSGPAENSERVVVAEVNEREGDVARPGFPSWGFGEESVADEVVVGGSRRRVDG